MNAPIADRLIEEALHRAANPEAITVWIAPCARTLAEQAGPLVASRLFPDRTFEPTLWAEPDEESDGWLVAVEDRGIRTLTTKGGPPPTSR